MGPPVDSVQLPYFSGFMVDITIVHRGFVMVYKPTNITGGAHPVTMGVARYCSWMVHQYQ